MVGSKTMLQPKALLNAVQQRAQTEPGLQTAAQKQQQTANDWWRRPTTSLLVEFRQQTELRPCQHCHLWHKKKAVKDAATSMDERSEVTDSYLSLTSSGHYSETDLSDAPAITSALKPRMPQPTTEAPLFWKPMDGQDRVPQSNLKDVYEYNHHAPQLAPPPKRRSGEALLNVRLVKVETSGGDRDLRTG